MNKLHLLAASAALVLAAGAQAKLPPLSPEAKAKADEAKAKAAWTDKVAGFKLCQSMDRTAAHYYKTSGKDPKAATTTAPCADPGPFVYTPEAAPAAGAPAAATPAAAAPPLEAAGAHSPAKTATAPPNDKATAAEKSGTTPKK
jgi:hypothetical protein